MRSPTNTWHPNKVWVLSQQVHDVTMGKLCGIASRLGRHGLVAASYVCSGLIGQNDRVAQLSEKRVPERIVLIHVQRTRNITVPRGASSQEVTHGQTAVCSVCKEVLVPDSSLHHLFYQRLSQRLPVINL